MSEVLIWEPEADHENIREGAQDLQSELHRRVYEPYFANEGAAKSFLESPRTYWRKKVLEKFELFKGSPISGVVMEIGAGTAWCAAYLSRRPLVERVFAVEYDRYALEHLMPKVFQHSNAREEIIARVFGSYNHMPQVHNRVDLIVSIGAIHHSENLYATMSEAYKVLKPGGYFLATEPCEPNTLSVSAQIAKGESEDPAGLQKYGRQIKHKENSDHYYRVCEFEAAAYRAGLDVWAYVFDSSGSWWNSSDRAFVRRKVYNGYSNIVLRPYFARRSEGKRVFDRLMLIAQRPL
ncbi:MAG: class I SAM-dependent methyltransferase [Betaproteobacteria bacterium]|nr:MAG: class I SAM-dependent methyltransferase [Betaproteobacteria bacterium]